MHFNNILLSGTLYVFSITFTFSLLSPRCFLFVLSFFLSHHFFIFFSVLYSTPLMTSESQGWLPRSRVRSTCFRHPLKSERERERERLQERKRASLKKESISLRKSQMNLKATPFTG